MQENCYFISSYYSKFIFYQQIFFFQFYSKILESLRMQKYIFILKKTIAIYWGPW